MKDFSELLESDSVYVFDGAMGTRLYDKGVYINRSYDELNVVSPDLVREVHAEYVKAGADIIETNSFGATRPKLQPYGLENRTREIMPQPPDSLAKPPAIGYSSRVPSVHSGFGSSRTDLRRSMKRKICSRNRRKVCSRAASTFSSSRRFPNFPPSNRPSARFVSSVICRSWHR